MALSRCPAPTTRGGVAERSRRRSGQQGYSEGVDAIMSPPDKVEGPWRPPKAFRLALSVLLVGVICHLSTQVGFAFKFPPHHISPLWPTGAILFSVLVVAPVRHWWAYILAAYFTGLMTELRAGFTIESFCFIVAGLCEIH